MKIRPLVSLEYRLAKHLGNARRKAYGRNLKLKNLSGGVANDQFPARVFSMSGHHSMPEQVASILSFLSHVGPPLTFTVISDGTLTASDCEVLRGLHPAVQIMPPQEILGAPLPQCIKKYAESGQPMGLKLAVLFILSQTPPVFYTDSDILFFPAAHQAFRALLKADAAAFFIADCIFSLDRQILRDDDKKLPSVNAGFIFFKDKFDWSPGISRLEPVVNSTTYFTEQTVVHLAMHHNKAAGLDPQGFILKIDDQLKIRDQHVNPRTVLRHYVSTIRHKFWLQIPWFGKVNN